jgi:hypothetical protein
MLALQPPTHLYIPLALLRWGLATTCNCLVDQQLRGTSVAAWPGYAWWLLLLLLLLMPAAVMLLEAQAASSAAALWAFDLLSDAEPGADDMGEDAGSKAAGAAAEQEAWRQEEASAGPGTAGPGTAEPERLCSGGDDSSDAPDDVPAAATCQTAVGPRAAVTAAALALAEAPAGILAPPTDTTHCASEVSTAKRTSSQMLGSSSGCPAGAPQPASLAGVDAGTAAAWDNLPAFDEDEDSWLYPPFRDACAGTISVKVSSGLRCVL